MTSVERSRRYRAALKFERQHPALCVRLESDLALLVRRRFVIPACLDRPRIILGHT